MKTNTRKPHLFLTISAAVLLPSFAIHAGTIWDGGAVGIGANDWGLGDNWNDNLTPPTGATVDLTFAGSTRTSPFNNYTAFDDFHSIFFDASAASFNLFGNAIDLFGKIENYSTNPQTVSLLDLAINAGQPGTGEFNPVNGDLTIASNNVFTNGNTLRVYGTNNKTVTFSASTVISQAGHFNVEQASNAVFLGNNTYTGTTNVLAGTLTVGNGGTTGTTGTGTVTVLAGGTLTYNRSDALTVANVLTGAGNYVKAGAGTLSLTGVNTLSGNFTISNGTVNAGANGAAIGTGAIVLGDANTGSNNVAFLTTTAGSSRPITVTNTGTGTATIGSTTGAGAGNVVFSGLVTLNRPTTISAASTDRTTWTGKITGNVGTLTIAGPQRTVFESANGLNDFVGDLSITGTGTVLQVGAGTLTGENIPNGSSVTVAAGAFLKLASVANSSETINAINGAGTIRRHEGLSGLATLTIGSAGGSGTFTGVLENGAGSLALVKTGSGTQTLNRAGGGGNNAPLGSATVNSGTLALVHTVDNFDRGYFTGTTPITINSGGTLDATRLWTIKSTNVVNINGGTLNFSSPFVLDVSDTNYVNNLTIQNGATISGPGGFRAGNVAGPTLTMNSSGNLTNTISTNLYLVKLSGITTYSMNVADGSAPVDLDFTGVIRDSSSFPGMVLNKAGAGNLRLSGANTFSGATTITGGTLTLGAGGTTGSLAGAINNSATLAIDRSGTATIGNTISGTGILNHTGSGITTLTGANSYTGATNVNTGALYTTPAQTGATTVNVADGATFGVKLSTAGTTLNVATLNSGTTSGATIGFDTGALGNPTAAMMNVATFTPTAPTTFRVVGSNLAAGTFPLFDYAGSIGGTGFAGISLALPFRVGGSLVDVSGDTRVDVNITGAETAKWQGNVNGEWDIDPNGGNTAGTFNWKTSLLSTSTRYAQGVVNTDVVTFDDTATGTTNVSLTTTLTPVSFTVNNSALNYTFSGAGKISGATGLTKQGSGTLTFGTTGGNDFTGAVSIQGGTVVASSLSDAIGAGTGAITLGSDPTPGTLRYTGLTAASTSRAIAIGAAGGGIGVDDSATTATFSGVISGGTLAKSGNGTALLTAANTYSGGTTISAGRLQGNTNTAFGSGAIIVGDTAANASIYLGQRADITNPITVSALGSGTVIIGADNSGSGANASTFAGLITLNRPTIFSGEVTSDRLAIDSQVTGNVGTLTVTGGARTTFFSTLNDFTGDIVVTGTGTILQASVATAAETIPNTSSVTVDTGAILQLASTGGAETINALNGAGTVRTFPTAAFGGNLTIGSANGSGSFTGTLINGAAPLSLTKTGTGTQTLSGVNTYTGATTVNDGSLIVNGSISGSATTVNAGTLGGNGTVGALTLAGGNLAPGNSAGILNTNGNTSFNGGTFTAEINGPTAGADYDQLNVTGTVNFGSTVQLSLSLGFDPADDGSQSFTLIANNDVDSISFLDSNSRFAIGANLLEEGESFFIGAQDFAISYAGGSDANDVVLTAIPEPGSAVLLLGGLAALGVRRRRK